jgi:hypothetical protein
MSSWFNSTLNQTFVADRRGADAKGRMTDERFVILAGSIAPSDVTGSFPDTKKAHRQKLIDKGVIEVSGGQLVFLENVLMGTPSGASTLIVGSPSNGWVDWKTQDGKTLDAATKEAKTSVWVFNCSRTPKTSRQKPPVFLAAAS